MKNHIAFAAMALGVVMYSLQGCKPYEEEGIVLPGAPVASPHGLSSMPLTRSAKSLGLTQTAWNFARRTWKVHSFSCGILATDKPRTSNWILLITR